MFSLRSFFSRGRGDKEEGLEMSKMNMIGDLVLIKREEAPRQSAGGVHFIEQTAQEQRRQSGRGEVLAVGPGKMLDSGVRVPPAVKVGDVVIIGRFTGTEIEHEGEKYQVVNSSEIMAVVDPE